MSGLGSAINEVKSLNLCVVVLRGPRPRQAGPLPGRSDCVHRAERWINLNIGWWRGWRGPRGPHGWRATNCVIRRLAQVWQLEAGMVPGSTWAGGWDPGAGVVFEWSPEAESRYETSTKSNGLGRVRHITIRYVRSVAWLAPRGYLEAGARRHTKT